MSEHKTVFIIEDDRTILETLQSILEAEGYAVHVAANGREALGLLATLSALPGLILLDLMMPVMNGIEFRQLQQNDPRLAAIPVAVMSAMSDIAEAKGMKPVTRLKKPIELEALLEVVHEHCS